MLPWLNGGPLVVEGAMGFAVGDGSVENVVESAAVHETARIGAVCMRAKRPKHKRHVIHVIRESRAL